MVKHDKETIKEISQHIDFEESLVCFVDLLGSTAAIEQNDVNFFNSINDIFNLLKRLSEIPDSNLKYTNIKVKAFSDNIIFVHRLPSKYTNEELYDALMTVTTFVSIFQSIALNKKIFLRGGISLGNIYFSDVFVWGKALVDAYRLESDIAVFPRVVIDKKIIKSVLSLHVKAEDKAPIERDFDEEYFVDFLVSKSDIFISNEISKFNSILNELESEHKHQNKVLQKISWTKAHISHFREKNGLTDEFLRMKQEILDEVMMKLRREE